MRFIAVIALACLACGRAWSGLLEEVVQLPVEVRDIHHRTHQHRIIVTIWRDDERGSSPFLVLNHGRAGSAERRAKLGRARYTANARYFVAQGFAVFVPTRVGYGVTGGPDVEYSGPCARRNFSGAFDAGVAQTIAVIELAKAQPYVDGTRGLLVGQSFGGAITVALASKNPKGILGAINFAGGSGGDPERKPDSPCSESVLRNLFGAYGKTSRIPAAWLYSENDRYWGRDNPRAWHETFRSAGGVAEFVQLPAFRADGHASFTGNPEAWRPEVEKFLASLNVVK
ncbi:MAG TPA: alpha/beta hydrolase [Burkholderiales bacterium]|nr:alpha/beta hydrolase [Burkholderiales bacterium]